MATISTRNNKIVVRYDDPNAKSLGKRKQLWESFDTEEEAKLFVAELEVKKLKKQFVSPSKETVRSLTPKWIKVYAPKHWGYSTYTTNTGLIENHILPIIGDMRIQEVTPMVIDALLSSLEGKKVSGPQSYNRKPEETKCLSRSTINTIQSILLCMFEKAVEWKIIESNPVPHKRPKKQKKNKRKAWTKGMMLAALDDIEHPMLHLAVHIAFVCSMRNGEVMALTWDSIDFDNMKIRVDKTLQRVRKTALAEIPDDELIRVFPEKVADAKSVLVLKLPKTEDSDRDIFFTEPIKTELLQRKAQLQKEMDFYGDRHCNYNLVFSLMDGYPVEPKLCEKWFKKWQDKTSLDFPEIVFHELRHTSATYKLRLYNGDIKTVQNDTGHASGEVLVDVYAHSLEEDRKEMMILLEKDFYQRNNDSLTEDDMSMSDEEILEQLLLITRKNPLLHQKVQSALLAP